MLALQKPCLFYQPGTRKVHDWPVLRLLYSFQVCMCVHTYHMHNDCVITITIQQSTSPVELLIVCWGLFGGGGGGGGGGGLAPLGT